MHDRTVRGGATAALVAATAALPAIHFGADRPLSQAVAAGGLLCAMGASQLTGSGRAALADAASRLGPLLLAVVGASAFALAGAHLWSIEPARAWDFALVCLLALVALPAYAAASAGRGTVVLLAVALLAAAGAAFGIVSTFAGFDVLAFGPKPDYLDWVTGFFVNRNAAADHFLLGLLACFVLWRRGLPPVLLVPLAAVTVAALLATGSRAGIAVALLSGLVLAVREGGRARLLITVAVAASIPLAGLVLVARSDTSGESDVARVELWQDAARSVALRPVTGSGAGTYPTVSALDRGADVQAGFSWDSSHNLYLDAAVTLGLPATAVIGLLLLIGLLHLARSDASDKDVALVALGAAMIHATVDFSPSTAGVLLALSVLVGVCAAPAARKA